jgi:hypothetical protein
MGRPAGWLEGLTGRSSMKSLGAPRHRREIEREFWRVVATGGGERGCRRDCEGPL